jgi:hypothetical protein
MSDKLTPLAPLTWPMRVQFGNDKFVPILRGREVAELFCVYVVAPVKSRTPIKVGHTGALSRRLSHIRNAYYYAGTERVELFWAAWFEDQAAAVKVEAMTHALLESKRLRNTSEWFQVLPEWGKQAILVAAKKADVPLITHEKYVSLCRWRSTIPLEYRIPRPRQRSEKQAVAQRVRNAVELACYIEQEARGAQEG